MVSTATHVGDLSKGVNQRDQEVLWTNDEGVATTGSIRPHVVYRTTLLRTGLYARIRLWRTLRAARIFAARGQTPEALRAWRLALDIFPGSVTAITALAAYEGRGRLDVQETRYAALQVQLDAALQAQLGQSHSSLDQRRFEAFISDSFALLEQRLRTAEASAIVARADWQSARRQVELKMDRIERNTTHLHETLTMSVRDAIETVEAGTARAEMLNAQLQTMGGQMNLALEHLTALKALSLVVSRQRQEIAALQSKDKAAAEATARLP